MLCTQAADCHKCQHGLFQSYVRRLTHDGKRELRWACFRCTEGYRETRVTQGELLGYYGSGQCDYCDFDAIILHAMLVTRVAGRVEP